ncbi:DUF2341 domain-containing protein [Gracilimonas sediminicola]|uniref:DUF2341 domain-containing protein n=1 Tax=Gracilimonas sediminicola TaxID=2952158 RepID=UPI0038D42709
MKIIRSAHIGLLTLLIALLSIESLSAQVPGYTHRKKFAVNNGQVSGSTNLTDFPVLISLTDNDLRTTGNGGDVENANGYDIVFTSSDGSTLLDHELESYNAATGEILFWVRFPTLNATSDTEFFIYYGNSSQSTDQSVNTTWDSGYQMVLHLDNDLSDATSNGNDATTSGTSVVNGIIGDGRDFNAGSANDIITIANDPSIEITDDITISFWMNGSNLNSVGPDLVTKGAYNSSYAVYYFNNITVNDDGTAFDGSAMNDGQDYYVTFTNSTANGRTIYIDGAQDVTNATAFNFTPNGDNLTLSSGSYQFDGMMDEVRISNVARSADWISTEYNNQNAPGSFISEIPDPPTLADIESSPQNFFAGGSPVFVTSAITIDHPYTSNLSSAEIEITGNYNASEDVLDFTDQNGITGSWNSGTGILSLSGSATLAQYQAALRDVTYENTNGSTPDQSTRTISFTVNDGSNDSNTQTRDINIITTLSDLSTDLANPVFHYDALDVNGDLNLGNQPGDGTSVATWGDRSDNAVGSGTDISASNGTAAQQPIFDSNYFGERGGILWDGTDDNLDPPNNAILNTGTYDEKSFAIVFRTGASTAGLQIIYEQGGGTRGYQISIKDGNAYAFVWNNAEWGVGNQYKSINLGAVQPNESYIIVASHDATAGALIDRTWSARINDNSAITLNNVDAQQSHAGGAIIGEENGTRDPVTTGNNPAGTNNFTGYIGEFVSWNTALNGGQMASVYDFLCDKWCNEPPVLAAIEGTDIDYTEGDAPTSITSTLTVSDSDNTVLDSAQVIISSNFDPSEDVLDFTPTGSITGSFNATTGVLLLTGQDSPGNYQTVLRSVTYENTNSVSPSTALRTVDFEVYDWDDVSNTLSRNVNVISVNSTPSLSGISGPTLTYTEGTGAVSGGAAYNATITDNDDTNMESATVAITNNYTLGEDELGFTPQFGINGSWNSTTGILTLTGTASLADYQTALENVTYENLSADPVEITRTFSFTVNDGDANSNTETRDLDIVAVNSAPILSGIETSDLNYDNAPIEITSTLLVSDPDNTQLDSAFVIITDNFKPAEDSLLFSGIFGITGDFDDQTGRLKLTGTNSLSDYETALRTVEYKNFATIPTGPEREVSFVAHDGALASDTVARIIEVNAVEAISGLEVWLRADAGVVTSGSEVVTWQDQSGNSNDFVGTADAGTRPTFVSSSTPLNNQPSINFAGDGDFFEDSDGENYINGSTEFTIFMVYKSDQTNTDRGLFNVQNPNNADEFLTFRYDAAGANNNGAFTNVVKTGILANDPDNQLESFSDIQATAGQIFSFQWQSGNTYDIFIDGILNNPSAAGPPPTGTLANATTAIVGKGGKDDPNTANQSWDGEIAEFIYYSRLLSQAERENVEDYLSDKYTLSIRKITAAENGENISADDANSTYTSLTGPIIKEGFAGELSAGGTFVLDAPTGFEWNTGATPSVSTSAVYGGTTTLAVSFNSITSTQVTFTVNTASTSNPGEIDISGLQIRPTTGLLPNSGNITNSGTTGLGGGTNYGSLSMVAGALDSLVITQQPSSTNVNTAISPAVRVQLTDQFGNNVKQSGVSVDMALTSGTGTLSGTTTQLTNSLGIADFSNLEIDDVGTKQITASSSGLDDAVSSNFNIVNAGVLTGFKVERVPSGNISPKVAGQNFNIKITAIDGSGTTVTTFSGTTVVTSSCDMGTGQGTTPAFSSGVLSSLTVSITSVGNCTITATNSAGSETGVSNSFAVSAGAPNETETTISASPTVILNDGASTSTITVQAKDAYGNNVTTGGATVVLSTDEGSIGGVTDNSDGTYTATLTSSTSTVVAIVSGTLNGNTISDDAQVEFASFSHIWESQLGSVAAASNYYDPDNWNVNSVPNASSVVLIPASPAVGNEFPVVNITDTEIAALSIEASAELNVSGGVNFIVSGDVTGSGDMLGSNNDSLTIGGNLNLPTFTLGNVIFNGSSDQTIESPHTFVNVEIDNPGTVEITDNFTVTGTLTLTNGELLIPSGKNLIANTQSYGSGELRFQRKISGVRGWRMLSSPVSSTIGDFLDGTLTQGYTGATYSTGSNPGDTLQPNVMWYLEDYDTNEEGLPATDNDRLRAPSNITNSLVSGRGYWVYFFGDIAADPLYNNPLPDTLDVAGQEFGVGSTEVDFGVTYTPEADSGWNFVGNPFGAAINWNNASNWTKTNIESTIYIWDPAANSGNGEFLTWNGSTGSLGSGIIPAFQGFWVKANAPAPVLKVKKAAKTTGGNFLRKEAAPAQQQFEGTPPVLELKAEGNGLAKVTHVMLSQNGATGKDPQDALRLLPFSDSHIEFYSTLDDGTELVINNRSSNFIHRQNIPLHFQAYLGGQVAAGSYTLRWPGLRNVPEEWMVILFDYETGREINLREQEEYVFTYNSKKKMKQAQPTSGSPSMNKNKSSSRFLLRITTEEIEANIPEEVYLYQNYPNPFNPTTTIPFGLTEETEVTLEVFDILGRKVQTLVSEKLPAGIYNIPFRAGSLASGVYLYRVITNQKVMTNKMVLIK